MFAQEFCFNNFKRYSIKTNTFHYNSLLPLQRTAATWMSVKVPYEYFKICVHLLVRVLSNIMFKTNTLCFVYTSLWRVTFIKNKRKKKYVVKYASSMNTTQYTSKRCFMFEIAVSHLFLIKFSNYKFILVNMISRSTQSPRK